MLSVANISQHHRRGFSVVEALSAGMVLAIASVMIAASLSNASAAGVASRDQQRAAAALDLIMTRIDLIGPDRLLQEGPLSGTVEKTMRWSVAITPLTDGYLHEITCTVSWNTPQGTRTAEVRTLLNDPPNSRNAFLRWEDL